MKARLFHLHALSALHCGTGQSVGVVDLPIARARATNLPLVPGSSIRGVLRDDLTSGPGSRHTGVDKRLVATLFGPEKITENSNAFAGALAVGDGHLLCLPVRALAGILCYVTSPFILTRYARDREMAGLTSPKVPTLTQTSNALVGAGSANARNNTLILEDLDLSSREDDSATQWAKVIAEHVHPQDDGARADLCARFAIVHNDVMSHLSEMATEIRARIAINDETGVVKKGALWYEENLPAEAVLWGVYAVSESRNRQGEEKDERGADELAKLLPDGLLLQLGGKAGVGRGLVRLYV